MNILTVHIRCSYVHVFNFVGCKTTLLGISQKEVALEADKSTVQQVVHNDAVYMCFTCDNNNTQDCR